jgi:branched-chain amino acid transport system ATP-binding protein
MTVLATSKTGANRAPQPLLEVHDLHVRYGAVHALQGVSIHVPQSKCIAVVGVNGAGKSTLAKAIAGTLRPAAGEIRFKGVPLGDSPAYKRVRLGIALSPERRRLFTEFTVDQNLTVGTPPGRSGQRDLVRELFPILAKRADQRAGTLSGGEQQMLAIARAMMSEPILLVLDEPSLGLSPIMRRTVFSALSAIRSPSCTVMIMEQNMTETVAIADHVYVMRAGRVEWEGMPSGSLAVWSRMVHSVGSGSAAENMTKGNE